MLIRFFLVDFQHGHEKYKITNFMAPFYGWVSNVSRLQSHYEETVNFLPFSYQELQVLNWSTLDR